jgi:hypothetical protein
VCKDQLGLTGCQARSTQSQMHHMTCCLVAFCVLERERQECHLSIYKLKRQLSLHGPSMVLPTLGYIGWALDRHLEAEFALIALRMALAMRNARPGFVHHSDRGLQYASQASTNALNACIFGHYWARKWSL